MDRVALCALTDLILHCVKGREFNSDSKKIAEVALESGHLQEREPASAVELRHQVDIGIGIRLAARNRPEEAQMDNSHCLQLRLVGTKCLDDRCSVHYGSVAQTGELVQSMRGLLATGQEKFRLS